MPNISNLGYLTDSIVHQFSGIVEEHTDYFVIRTPSNPTYYWGNLTLFKHEPVIGDYERWMAIQDREFGPDAGHVTFGWDSSDRGEISQFTDQGFEFENQVVLRLNELRRPRIYNDAVEVRAITSDHDWDALVELQIECGYPLQGGDEAGYRLFKERGMKTYRLMQDTGRGDWWGAFLNGELVGDMGLYFTENEQAGRFQSVETSAKHRRQGICSTLLYEVSRQTMTDAMSLVIVAGSDEAPAAIYQSLGYEMVSHQYGVCRRPRGG